MLFLHKTKYLYTINYNTGECPMSKPVRKFINLSEEWELNYCLKKYNYRETRENRENLINLIRKSIKPYFKLQDNETLSWNQSDTYYYTEPKGLKFNKL